MGFSASINPGRTPGEARPDVRPLTDAQVEAKFFALAEPMLGRTRADGALRWLWQLEQARPVAELPPLIELAP